ncbi:MAG: class I SAM-dependent methyltransferase [Puniceicoccales bacterium]|jgi:predicted RNA methylase|nr:class I SAM-dependent methyltransferase [Puniceicoccales bacterium]
MSASATVEDVTHLTYREKTNLGSFYTPLPIVRRVYDLLRHAAGADCADVILENACGYGAFFAEPSLQKRARLVGADLDTAALGVARRNFPSVEFIEANALLTDIYSSGRVLNQNGRLSRAFYFVLSCVV